MAIVVILATMLVIVHSHGLTKYLSYEDARNAVIRAEETLMTGGKLFLNPKERAVDEVLKSLKKAEIAKGFNDPSVYAPSMHFFQAKPLIEQSEVFKFIREMPKGSVLHGHNTAMTSSNWVIKNATYRPNAMKCVNKKGLTIFTFRKIGWHDCTSYVNIADERRRARDPDTYDRELERLINLYTPTPEINYPHIGAVWSKFQNMFGTITDLISYFPVFREYHWQLLEEMYKDGVMYIEFRTSFTPFYDDFNEFSRSDSAREMENIIRQFTATHEGFLGAKTIYSTSRNTTTESIQERIRTFRDLYSRQPDFIVGFDLVGQEDIGKPLYDFILELKTLPPGAQFFFHAGETNWYGSSTDYNLLDAVLLNTTRIGHGYALVKHPVLWNAVKSRGVVVEVNPISNQVLHLVWDLRNHPAAFFISEDIPIVISNDDPGFWNAKGLSYDFYYAFMCFTPNDAGLATLKHLVWNSIQYAVLSREEKNTAIAILQQRWDNFLDNVLNKAYGNAYTLVTMRWFLQVILATVLVFNQTASKTVDRYNEVRDAIITAEEQIMMGGRLTLTKEEQIVENILQQYKRKEIKEGLKDPTTHAPAMHFFHAKEIIDNSEVFKFIQKMPKGAVLHGHNTAMVSSEWIIKNVTYRPNIMKCIKPDGKIILTFRHRDDCKTHVLIADERKAANDANEYDKGLEKLINMYTPKPEDDYPHITAVWRRFQDIFGLLKDVLSYLPVYRDYHWRLLEELYEDGVMYVEIRTSFRGNYDENTTYSLVESVKEMRDIVNRFKETHPGFFGAKAIYSTNRNVDGSTIDERIKIFKNIYSQYPDFIVGFDLVGQEDLGAPLQNFVKEFQYLPEGAQFFFHAGETNWYGSSTDWNLLDALLLNTTRIGHGYALFKHPVLWNAVKNRGIAIEVSPISNQVLHLVWDLRNHPGSFFVSENLPMVICNDDPGYWNAKGISYDMYYAFMSFTPNNAGLAILKHMVLNSLKYSVFNENERIRAYALFDHQWNNFINRGYEDGHNSAPKLFVHYWMLFCVSWLFSLVLLD